jgi:hypothetical protein
MKITVTISLTPAQMAEAFCAWDDEKQAQFFIECAAIAKKWDVDAGRQWTRVGGHLRKCSCSTDEARDLVRDIASGIGAA